MGSEEEVESGAISVLTSFTLGPGERTIPLSWLEGMVRKTRIFLPFSRPSPLFFIILRKQRKQSLIIRGELITKLIELKGQSPFLVEAPFKAVYLISYS